MDEQEQGRPADAELALTRALIAARGEIGELTKSGLNEHTGKPYLELADLVEAVVPALLRHGLMLTQTPVEVEGRQLCQAVIEHEAGGRRVAYFPMVVDGNMNAMQRLGSAFSYARRYQIEGLFCLRGKDDDGASAGSPARRERERDEGRPARPIRPPNGERANMPPRTGAELYARLKDKGRQDLIDALQAWGDRQDPALPARMRDWPVTAIQAAWTFALAEGRRRREAEDAELDRQAARDAGRN